MFQRECLGLEDAERAMNAILDALTPEDSPIALAIADEHGVLVCCLRQDGAATRMIRRATAKAYTAAVLGTDTVVFRDDVLKAEHRTLSDWGDPMITSLQGGLVVRSNGKVVGGIAMSGNNTKRDEGLSRIGLNAMGLS
jgi:glc operon protein GlcG